MTPTALYESIASICMSVIKPPYFAERPVTSAEMSEITYRILRFAEKFEEDLLQKQRTKENEDGIQAQDTIDL